MKCPNCDAPIERVDAYCWSCGQKNKESRVKLITLLGEALEQISNLDAAFFKTVAHIVVPGKLIKAFFKGERKRYVTPFRFFFIAALIHFALIGYISSEEINPRVNSITTDEVYDKGYREIIYHELEGKMASIKDSLGNDSLINKAFNSLLDSMDIGNHYFIANSVVITSDSIPGEDDLIEVPYSEIIRSDLDSLAEKYNMNGGFKKIKFIQQVKMVRDPKGFLRFILGNLIWMSIGMVVSMALVMQLLFLRSRLYLVEHLVFNLYFHSFSLWMFSIVIAVIYWFQLSNLIFLGVTFLLVLVYLFLSLKRYYELSKWKAILFFAIYSFSYVLIFLLFTIFTVLTSVLLI